MLRCASVQSNLNYCSKLFEETSDIMLKKFIIRMALLEVCGWIEEALDAIYQHTPHKQPIENFKVLKLHIDHLYSFEYNEIIKTSSLIIGSYLVNFIEKNAQKMHPRSFNLFKSSLNSLKKYRDNNAHTNTENCADAPELGFNALNTHFKNVKLGLCYIEFEIRKNISKYEENCPF